MIAVVLRDIRERLLLLLMLAVFLYALEPGFHQHEEYARLKDTITINVTGGATINSATSVTVTAGNSIRLHAFSDGGSNVRWLSW